MRIYSLLLLLYPASFRAEYGGELRALFARRRADAVTAGARIALWAETVVDVAGNAVRLHGAILRQDVGYALRTLRRTPAFTLTAILVSALGIGATTAAFSITDHVLIRPLPFSQPDRLVKVWQNQQYRGYPRMEASPPNYLDWQRASTSFERMSAFWSTSTNLSGGGEPLRLNGVRATGEIFLTLGSTAALGRTFLPTDAASGATDVVVLSDALWREVFAADPGVLGRRVLLDDAPYVVVGVMPPDFIFPTRDTRYWTPLRFDTPSDEDRTNYMLQVIARLAPGVTIDQARAEMATIAAGLERAYPTENAKTGITINGLRDEVGWQTRMLLLALVGASLCVLLIACSNLVSLLLARALARQRELAVRAALGAGRERLLRQVLTEGLVLAGLGGLLGVALALVAGPLFARLVPTNLPIGDVPGVDLRVLGFACAVTLLTGLGFGAVPALRASRLAAAEGLREGGRAGASRLTERLRSGLIVAQVASSIVLLIAAGLLIRALWAVQQRDPGFRTEGVITLRTMLPMPRYEATERRGAFYRRVLGEVSALPGVSSAAYTSFLPMTMRGGIWAVTLDGQPPDPSDARTASVRFVTPGYFQTMGVPLVRGRDVSEADTPETPLAAVISESFAKNYWPGQDPIGHTVHIMLAARTVVGIVGDVRVRGLERESEPQVYLPYRQVQDGWFIGYAPKDLAVRASTPAATLLPSIRDIIRRADPQLPISDVRTLAAVVDGETTPRRVQVGVLGAFAAVALLLSGVGVHGLLAFAVSSRQREIGVRLALGASGADVLRMVLRQGLWLAAAGAAVGVALAYAASQAMQALLAGVSPGDLTTFAAAVGFVLAMVVAGALPPALRAARVDPATAMRAE